MVSEELKSKLQQITQQEIYKVIVSKPSDKAAKYRKIEIEKKSSGYQAAAYTQKQVFHEKIEPDGLLDYLSGRVGSEFLQLNAWDGNSEYMLLISKKGKVTYRCKKQAEGAAKVQESHNRKKKYLLEEGTVIPPLVDMGVFTVEGKVVRTMYDKFRQINRFLEIIEDGVRDYPYNHLNIIDFGCGKSYLTFILYYYFAEIKKMNVQIVGLDLKEDVIKNCNLAAEKYGYHNLHFELGDINGYQTPFPVDMVVTLHACDTATDYALYNAVQWDAKMIFSVPCCQHELNGQIETFFRACDRCDTCESAGGVRIQNTAFRVCRFCAYAKEYSDPCGAEEDRTACGKTKLPHGGGTYDGGVSFYTDTVWTAERQRENLKIKMGVAVLPHPF